MPHLSLINEPKIVCPTSPDYELPITILDSRMLTPNDEELLQSMAQYRPKTRFKAGDLAYLNEIPFSLRRRGDTLPQVWKIRFVISAWAYELMCTSVSQGGNLGMDRAIALMEMNRYRQSDNERPVIYAHGYPHGLYPNTAAWLPERVLRKLVFREPNAGWQHIVEEAGAKFYGYDAERIPTNYAFSIAPDDYSHGGNIGRPFQHEEDVTHSACLSGLEEYLFVPLRIGAKKKAALPQDHSVFSS